jgi:hypothetical protein
VPFPSAEEGLREAWGWVTRSKAARECNSQSAEYVSPPNLHDPAESWNENQLRRNSLKSDSDRMPANLFAEPPEKIVEVLSSREAFPQGAASGMRVLSFYISRSAKGLSPSRRRNLEKAKQMLSHLVELEMADRDKWRRKVA